MFSVILALILTNIALFAGLFLYYRREKARFFNYLKDNLDPEKPSQIYGFTDVLAKQMGQAAISSLKGTAMAQASGVVRGEKAVDAAMLQDGITAMNPLIGLAIEQLPQLKKLIRNKPEMAAMAAQKIAGMLNKDNNQGGFESPCCR